MNTYLHCTQLPLNPLPQVVEEVNLYRRFCELLSGHSAGKVTPPHCLVELTEGREGLEEAIAALHTSTERYPRPV